MVKHTRNNDIVTYCEGTSGNRKLKSGDCIQMYQENMYLSGFDVKSNTWISSCVQCHGFYLTLTYNV